MNKAKSKGNLKQALQADKNKEIEISPVYVAEQNIGRNQNIDSNDVIFDKEEQCDSDIDDEETNNTGTEEKYSLQIPSMVTHLKRRDSYLDSLDSFLNENLKVIADLIKIK